MPISYLQKDMFTKIRENLITQTPKAPLASITYGIEGTGALVNEAGEETPLKAGDFALVNPSEKHQYRNKGDKPFKMICGVPKDFE